jgi:hypothetical protein
MLSLYPPPQSSTLSPTNLTFQIRWGSRSDSGPRLDIFDTILKEKKQIRNDSFSGNEEGGNDAENYDGRC